MLEKKRPVLFFCRSGRIVAAAFFLVAGLMSGGVGCRREKTGFGSGQRASQAEQKDQNRSFLTQLVTAAEEQERHPDLSYLQNALSRLNAWLVEQPGSRDFSPFDEYTTLAEWFAKLSAAARTTEENYLALTDLDGTPTQGEGDALIESLGEVESLCALLAERFGGKIFTQYGVVAAELRKALLSAKEYQFGDKGKQMQTAVTRFALPPTLTFATLANGTESLSRLYRLEGRAFCPEDSHHLREAVWMRNVSHWAKGGVSEDAAVVMNLFDWTCDAIASEPVAMRGAFGEIRQLPWETALMAKGTGRDRAAVFMELLRQNRIDSFLIHPTKTSDGADGNRDDSEPILVGVIFDGAVRLFCPTLGLPVPGPDGVRVETDGAKKGLVFSSVATLDEAASNGAILRRLDRSTEEKFPLSADDLASVTALVPAGPFVLSERMRILERDFSGDVFTVLSASPQQERGRIAAASKHITSVSDAWELQTPLVEQTIHPAEVDLLTAPYRYSMEAGRDLASDSDGGKGDVTPEEMKSTTEKNPASRKSPANDFLPLWQGKVLYLAGKFTGEDGAAYWLQQGKIPDRILRQAASDIGRRTMEFAGMIAEQMSREGKTVTEEELRAIAMEYARNEQESVFFKIFLKIAVRFHLALISHAVGNDAAAVEHLQAQLQDPVLTTDLGRDWRPMTIYLLAKLSEQRGDFSQAASLYRALDGPAGYGAKLRAAWLLDPQSSAE